MSKKSICINNCEVDLIGSIKKQVIKLGSPKANKVKELMGTLNYLESKFQNNIENLEIVENSRTLDDLVMHLHFTDELKWYYDLLAVRSEDFDNDNPKLNMSKEELENAKRIAIKVNIQDHQINDYTHGMLHGKSIALRWILGEEWNDLHS